MADKVKKEDKKEVPAEKKEEAKTPEAPKAEEVKTEEKTEKPKEEKAEKKPALDDASLSAKAPGDKKAKLGKPSGKYKDIIEQIEKLSVLELSELVKDLEDRFGVSAAPAAVAAPATGGEQGGDKGGDEKTTATVHLVDSGAQKIAVIKALREINPELGLKEAKDLADSAPKDIKTDIPKEEAKEAKKKLEEAGGKVELK